MEKQRLQSLAFPPRQEPAQISLETKGAMLSLGHRAPAQEDSSKVQVTEVSRQHEGFKTIQGPQATLFSNGLLKSQLISPGLNLKTQPFSIHSSWGEWGKTYTFFGKLVVLDGVSLGQTPSFPEVDTGDRRKQTLERTFNWSRHRWRMFC